MKIFIFYLWGNQIDLLPAVKPVSACLNYHEPNDIPFTSFVNLYNIARPQRQQLLPVTSVIKNATLLQLYLTKEQPGQSLEEHVFHPFFIESRSIRKILKMKDSSRLKSAKHGCQHFNPSAYHHAGRLVQPVACSYLHTLEEV